MVKKVTRRKTGNSPKAAGPVSLLPASFAPLAEGAAALDATFETMPSELSSGTRLLDRSRASEPPEAVRLSEPVEPRSRFEAELDSLACITETPLEAAIASVRPVAHGEAPTDPADEPSAPNALDPWPTIRPVEPQLPIEEPARGLETRPEPTFSSPPACETHAVEAFIPPPAREYPDLSIPPVETLADEFFATGERVSDAHLAEARRPEARPELEEAVGVNPKMTPAVRARRAKLARYVQGAVAASALLCVAALGSFVFAQGPSLSAAAATHRLASPDSVEPIPMREAELPPTAIRTAEIPEVEPSQPALPETEAPPGEVLRESARSALTKRKLDEAVELGERAVQADPTDADAWLVLGATHLERGDRAAAKRSFVECTKSAKKGTLGECFAMLR